MILTEYCIVEECPDLQINALKIRDFSDLSIKKISDTTAACIEQRSSEDEAFRDVGSAAPHICDIPGVDRNY